MAINCNLYISEISPAFCRGQLGGYRAFSVTAGILFLHTYFQVLLALKLVVHMCGE